MTDDEAHVLMEQEDAAYHAGDCERAVELCDQVLQDSVSERIAPEALFRKARALLRLGHGEEAVVLWRSVYRSEEVETLAPALALQARSEIANYRAYQGQIEDTIDLIKPLMERLGDTSHLQARALAAKYAKWTLHVLISHRDSTESANSVALRNEQALTLARTVVDELGDETDPELAYFCISARLSRMLASMNVGNAEEAQATFEELIAGGEPAVRVLTEWENNLSRSQNPDRFSPQIVMALTMRAGALAQLERREEAVAVLDGAIRRFSSTEVPEVQALLGQAQELRGELLDEDPDPA